MKHIRESEYIINMSEKYKENLDIFNAPDIKFAIDNKFGGDVYKNLQTQLKNQSLQQHSNDRNTLVDSMLQKTLNNWVVAKIGFSPTVFIRQLGAITNYAVDVKTKDWITGFKYGLINPRKTMKYMTNLDFVQERLNNGYNRELQDVLKAKDGMIKLEKFFGDIGKKIDQTNFTNIFTALTRYGDLTSVVFGGYANIQANIKAGMTEEQAIEAFEIATIRTQQSSLKSNLSTAQQSKHIFIKLMYTFRSASIQYQRNIFNAVIQQDKKEISDQQYFKVLFNYGVVQPAMYVLLGKIATDLLLSWDDEEEKEQEFLNDFKEFGVQMLGTFTVGLPLIDEAIETAYNKMTGQKSYNNTMGLVLFEDMIKTTKRIGKEDITAQDVMNMFLDITELSTSIPAKNINRIQKQFTGFDATKDLKE